MKLKFAALAVGMLGACALIGGCGNDSKHFTENEFFGVGAESCVEILGSSLNAKSIATLAAATDGDIKDEAEDFNKYFAALNSFLDDSALSVEATENKDEAYAQFDIKLTVSGKDFAGNATEYIMYYNEAYVWQKNDGKETYSLNGIMISDGAEYILTGGKTVETKKGKREEELVIYAFIGDSFDDSVRMKYEGSVDGNENEKEYVYSICSDNKVVEETTVKFETENNETEFELEFIKGGAKGKYKVEREINNGVTEISVKYDLDGKQGKFTIKEIIKDGQSYYEYTFDDNSHCTFENHHGNHGEHGNHHNH